MKVGKADTQKAVIVLAGMVMSDAVLRRCAAKWDGQPLFNGVLDRVVKALVRYQHKYHKAPRENVRHIVSMNATRWGEENTALIEQCLEDASRVYASSGEVNDELVLDMAEKLFRANRLRQLTTDVECELETDTLDRAEEVVQKYRRVDLSSTTGGMVDVGGDDDFWKDCFPPKPPRPLVSYPGDLGQFFGDSLQRDQFYAFMAPDKVGKTFFLLDMALRACRQKRRVMFWSVGDMTRRQVGLRVGAWLARAPFKSTRLDKQWPCEVRMPRGISRPRKDSDAWAPCEVACEDIPFDNPLDLEAVRRARERFFGRGDGPHRFVLNVVPPGTLTVPMLESELERYRDDHEGWAPDVLVIDYSDIMAAVNARLDKRDQVNEIWTALRALSMRWHCLVVTASQTDAEAYRVKVITRQNFSEDKRKLAIVDGMVGINMTPDEQRIGVRRLNWVVRREEEYDPYRCVHLASCLPLARPAVLSCW